MLSKEAEVQKASVLEKVKRELRSVLITAKTGVPLNEIQSKFDFFFLHQISSIFQLFIYTVIDKIKLTSMMD